MEVTLNRYGYYIDENGNRWNKERNTFMEAITKSDSMSNSYNCIDCDGCKNCYRFYNCKGCENCTNISNVENGKGINNYID